MESKTQKNEKSHKSNTIANLCFSIGIYTVCWIYDSWYFIYWTTKIYKFRIHSAIAHSIYVNYLYFMPTAHVATITTTTTITTAINVDRRILFTNKSITFKLYLITGKSIKIFANAYNHTNQLVIRLNCEITIHNGFNRVILIYNHRPPKIAILSHHVAHYHFTLLIGMDIGNRVKIKIYVVLI